jgi:hypothetical protein
MLAVEPRAAAYRIGVCTQKAYSQMDATADRRAFVVCTRPSRTAE